MIIFDDEYFMKRALVLAQQAADEGEVPVGAVAVRNDSIIASAYNQVEKLKDATAHAEIILLTKVSAAIGDWRLNDVTVYVTKEPCPMCAGALINSRVKRVVFGMGDPRFGAAGGAINIFALPDTTQVLVNGGLLEEEAKEIMQAFFKEKRTVRRRSATLDSCTEIVQDKPTDKEI